MTRKRIPYLVAFSLAHQVSCEVGGDCVLYVRAVGAFEVAAAKP